MILKLTLLVLFSSSALAVSSPPRLLSDLIDQLGVDDATPLVDPYDGISYRLPNTTVPLTYDLFISTDIHLGEFNFEGRVVIRIEAIETTDEIVVQYRQLNIDSVAIWSSENQLIQTDVPFTLNETVEFLTITPNQQLIQGEQYLVEINYNGVIRDDFLGLFRASYVNPEGETKWLAATQFKANRARSAFPSYDEPAIRSLFTVSIRHDAGYEAVSNTPVASIVPEDGTNYVLTTFEQTLSMQAYILAFYVSDLVFVEDASVQPSIRIYGRQELIQNGDGSLALEAATKMLEKYREYFTVPYPYPKYDQIAFPQYPGVVESWAAPIYRENILLFDENLDRTQDRENIITLITHIIGHQWFGNLASPEWWSFAWINEGFAALMEHYLTDQVFPEDDIIDHFYVNFQRLAMENDVDPNVRPMSYYVENPETVETIFSLVTVRKAAMVLFMIQNAISPQTFSKGFNYLLSDRAFNFYNADQLYVSLQRAIDEDYPEDPINIEQIFSSWELNPGVPVLHVDVNGTEMTFTQERFFLNGQDSDNIWSIPINYAVGSNPDFTITKPDFWLHERSKSIQSSTAPKPWTANDCIIVNARATGYYRVDYDIDTWLHIINHLHGPFHEIDPINRAQLVDDSFNLARNGRIGYDVALGIMDYLRNEVTYVPWALANRANTLLNRWLIGTVVYSDYQAYIRANVELVYSTFGANIRKDDSRVQRFTRAIAIDLACRARSEQCLSDTSDLLQNLVQSGTPIAPDVQQTIYCNGVRLANATTVQFLQNRLQSTTRQPERGFILAGLGCVEDPEVLYNHLLLAIRPGFTFTNTERFNILNSPLNHGDVSLQVLIDFIRLNYGGINLIDSAFVGNLVSNIATRISSERMFTEFESLTEHLELNGALTAGQRTNFRTSAREILAWQDDNLFDFIRYFYINRPN